MKANGFPTAEERDWASNRSADEIQRRAEAEGSAALKALSLEARLRERTLTTEAFEIYNEQLNEALSTGKRYFLYGAIESGMAQGRDTAARRNELQGAGTTSGASDAYRFRANPMWAANALSVAVTLGDYRALDLAAGNSEEMTLLRAAFAEPATSRNAWQTLQNAAQMPGAPISIRTPQPRPLPPPGSD